MLGAFDRCFEGVVDVHQVTSPAVGHIRTLRGTRTLRTTDILPYYSGLASRRYWATVVSGIVTL